MDTASTAISNKIDSPFLKFLKIFGTATGIAAALMIAANLPISGWGFVVFLFSSVSWTWAALLMGVRSLALLEGVFTLVNVLGIYRWLLA